MTQEIRPSRAQPEGNPPEGNQKIRLLWSLVGLLTLLLGLSISLNRTLWQRAKDHYIGIKATRLNPIGLKAFSNSEVPAKHELTRVVFFGDSRAAAWPPLATEGYEFINRGLGSQTSVQDVQRFQAQVPPLQPDIVIIQVGINDIKAIGLFPNQAPTILADVRTNIEQLVIQAEATGATVILSAIFPTGKVPLTRKFSLRSRPFWLSDTIDPAIVEVNQSLKKITTEIIATSNNNNLIWFDSYTLLANEQGQVKQEYLADELHLNDRGYQVLNQALIDVLIEAPRKASPKVSPKDPMADQS